MPTSRCNFYVVDSETKRSRKCKNKKNKNLKIDCCTLHYKLMYEKYIILIQKVFRGNKIRNKLDNIYKKLPDELQRIVVNKAREDISYNNYKKMINNIINNRINNIINNTIYDNYYTSYVVDLRINVNLYYKNISKVCLLVNKYYSIYTNIDISYRYYKIVSSILYYEQFLIPNEYKSEIIKYCNLYK